MAFTTENMLSINITKFKKWGFLKYGVQKSGDIIWSVNDKETSRLAYKVNFKEKNPHFDLNYKTNGESFNYRIYFESLKSNLNKGLVWYFICPKSGEKSRKLFLYNGYFVNRNCTHAIYDTQTKSKSYRRMEQTFGAYFDIDNYYEEIHSKHFKKFYNGKPTKRYKRLLELIEKAENITAEQLERAMVLGV